MVRLRAPILLILLGAAASLAVASARHMRLERSQPEKDAVLSEAPREIRLWFSEEPQDAISRVALEGPAGVVQTGAPSGTDDPRSIKVTVESTLALGSYTVAWRAAGDDGHPIRGTFGFTLEAPR